MWFVAISPLSLIILQSPSLTLGLGLVINMIFQVGSNSV